MSSSSPPDYPGDREKHDAAATDYKADSDVERGEVTENELHRGLQSRHMQMIAIGGAIGAGLFVGSGGALQTGGPGSLVLGFIIVGFMLLLTVQALAELSVLYPVNGAFYQHICRFIDPSWGFALGWDYALAWLTLLPFEITAAGITIEFWRDDINIAVWIVVFLVVCAVIPFFGVRGYGEVEFVLSIIKVAACTGFIILGTIIDCGGVPTESRGYIGAKYWHDPGAFHNGFKGFCSVFVLAAFAFGGTELTGLAAAESANPQKTIPKATRQVFWRIAFFYVVNLFVLGLIVPSDSNRLLHSSGANTKASPFVIAIQKAGIQVLPSIFNAVITVAVISVANSATYGSTRTLQALAKNGMAPKLFAYIDKRGRPVASIALQLIVGLLAFINLAPNGSEVFDWLLALSGLTWFFMWGSICVAHVRSRQAWKAAGRSLDEIPYRAPFGIIGSLIGAVLVLLCLVGQFWVALFPLGGSPNAEAFFKAYLSAPIIVALFFSWKVYSAVSKDPKHQRSFWKLYMRAEEMDILTGLRDIGTLRPQAPRKSLGKRIVGIPKSVYRSLVN